MTSSACTSSIGTCLKIVRKPVSAYGPVGPREAKAIAYNEAMFIITKKNFFKIRKNGELKE